MYHRYNKYRDWRGSRKEWNELGIILAVILALFLSLLLFLGLSEKIYYQSEQTFISCDERNVETNIGSYKIYTGDGVVVNCLESKAQNGDKIVLTISKWTGELLEASLDGESVYQRELTSWNQIYTYIGFLVVMCILFAVFFYSINAANPPLPFSLIKQIFIFEKRKPHHSDYHKDFD